MFGSIVAWLQTPNGIALTGIAVWVAGSVIARYAPNTPGWMALRSIVADYAQKNAKALPASLGVRVERGPGSLVEVVLTVDGAEVRRYLHSIPVLPNTKGGAS